MNKIIILILIIYSYLILIIKAEENNFTHCIQYSQSQCNAEDNCCWTYAKGAREEGYCLDKTNADDLTQYTGIECNSNRLDYKLITILLLTLLF